MPEENVIHISAHGPLFTIEEIAERWKMSPDTVRRLFENEPGVLTLDNRDTVYKRRYRTLRIPGPVMERVFRRLQSPGGDK
jgi:hypothetical protein